MLIKPLGHWNVHFGLPERGFGAKRHFMWKNATLDKNGLGVFDFSHSKLYWLQPLQLEKGKEMHILGASWKGLMVLKSHFVRFKKRNLRKEFFNQIKSVLLRNQLNFNFFLGTKSALVRAVRVKTYGNFWVVHAHTFCGRIGSKQNANVPPLSLPFSGQKRVVSDSNKSKMG